jgi:mannose-1-phosphate guanylyltransferase/phosphomannomutase
MGAARLLQDRSDDVLVAFADNLTAVDLGSLVAHHVAIGPALTVATHREPFPMPFGEVEVVDGHIRAYCEKPVWQVSISSGLFVLSPVALEHIPPGCSVGASWLVNQLLEVGLPVAAWPHTAPWIDVNDTAAIERAEALVSAHLEAFRYISPTRNDLDPSRSAS